MFFFLIPKWIICQLCTQTEPDLANGSNVTSECSAEVVGLCPLTCLYLFIHLRKNGHVKKKRTPNLLIVGEAAHDSWVNDAAEQHGQRVDGQRAIACLLLHEVTQLFISHLHGLYGVRQRTNLLLHIGRMINITKNPFSNDKNKVRSSSWLLTTETDLTSNHFRIPGKR